MAVKEKGPIFKRGIKSCCDCFRFVYKMRRQRTPPIWLCVLRAELTRLQAKVKLKVVVWPRHCACWPIQTLMASLKAYKREDSNGEKSLVNAIREAFYFYWPVWHATL